PFGPIKPAICPLSTPSETSSTATTPPNRLVKCSTESRGTAAYLKPDDGFSAHPHLLPWGRARTHCRPVRRPSSPQAPPCVLPVRAAGETEDPGGQALELVVAPDPSQSEQHVREHRVSRRGRVVVELLLARHEPLAVRGRKEEAAVFPVDEELDRESGQPVRL